MDHSEGQAKYDRVLELCSNDFILDSANGDLPPLNEQHLSRMRQIIQNAMAVATLEVLQETSPSRQSRTLVRAGTKRPRDDSSDTPEDPPSSTPVTPSSQRRGLFSRPSQSPAAPCSQIGTMGPPPRPGDSGPPSDNSRASSCTVSETAENSLAPGGVSRSAGGENCSSRNDPAGVLPATHHTGAAEHMQTNRSGGDVPAEMPSGNFGSLDSDSLDLLTAKDDFFDSLWEYTPADYVSSQTAPQSPWKMP